jgi:hypothetical protein
MLANGFAGVALYISSALGIPSLIAVGTGFYLPPVACSAVAAGLVFRVACTLYMSLRSDVHLSRVPHALPRLKKAQMEYDYIFNHPEASRWNREVAAKVLSDERQQIFYEHGTSPRKYSNPMVAAGALNCWFLISVAPVIGEFLGHVDPSIFGIPSLVAQLGVQPFSPLGPPPSMEMVDPLLPLAALITMVNTQMVLCRKYGFSDMQDMYVVQYRRYSALFYLTLSLAAATGAVVVPPSIGAVWLGMSIGGILREVVHGVPVLRHAIGILDRPPDHGKVMMWINTAEGTENMVSLKGNDSPEDRQKNYHKLVKLLDYECDLRIYKLCKAIGVAKHDDEFERLVNMTAEQLEAVRRKKEEVYDKSHAEFLEAMSEKADAKKN